MKIYKFVLLCIVLLKSVNGKRDQQVVQEQQKRSLTNKQLQIILVYDEDLEQNRAFPKIKEAMQSASSYWEKTLKVKIDSEKPVHLPRECSNEGHFVEMKKNIPSCRNSKCKKHTLIQGVKIPNKYLSSCYHEENRIYRKVYSEGSGIAPNQLLIILTGSSRTPRDKCSNIHAARVATHPTTGRPFMGVLNYCLPEEELITITDDKLINLIKRELAHLLGFHPSIFGSEKFMSAKIPSVQNITLSWLSTKGTYKIQKKILSLPKMLKEAREHFDCSQLQGIELDENHLSHRVMGNDLMTPYPLESKRVSRITLAYFEDINMYDVDYSMADDFKWGKGLGCDFVLKSCYEYIKDRKSRGQDIEPYCDIPNEPKCAGYENGIGGCLLYEHGKQLNETFQYMDNLFPFTAKQKEKYGGHMAFDYCPVLIIQPGVNGSSLLCEEKDDLKTDSMLNMFMEYRGPNSGCFNDETQTYVNKSGTYTIKKKSSCHKFQCSKNIGVQVIFNEKAFQCPVGGGPLHMEQQLGSGNAFIDIQCPKCTSLCKEYCPK
ncbi:hypothetical protein MS3_00007219 [Schistosoma haematobium]|uniref:Leishmanolysin-like peptidase n=1 Tax=Schistosoma haematobium TaxID=6185 RepID=A0A922LG16_SCHHA|nr:hypothetical protein MS3_00007219 [Schistosoma haematobium]KAH9582469.1 hypothetical protein MS3_00007219 [Schistosoma haematobium]